MRSIRLALLSAVELSSCHDDTPVVTSCPWATMAQPRPLAGEVAGVLRGSSRNASTTCTRREGAGGPEAVYRLHLDEPRMVDITVAADFETVIAVRSACDDPLSVGPLTWRWRRAE